MVRVRVRVMVRVRVRVRAMVRVRVRVISCHWCDGIHGVDSERKDDTHSARPDLGSQADRRHASAGDEAKPHPNEAY
jgi:hypothetical protein